MKADGGESSCILHACVFSAAFFSVCLCVRSGEGDLRVPWAHSHHVDSPGTCAGVGN